MPRSRASVAVAASWEPACMDPDEWAAWRALNDRLTSRRADRPCSDCLLGYAAEMRAEGRCNGTPGGDAADDEEEHDMDTGRTLTPVPVEVEQLVTRRVSIAVTAPRPPARGPGAPPSENQERAWRAVTERGLYWPDVARELGTTAWSVKNMIQAYMRRNGIPGEPPGRTPKDEAARRTMAAKGQKREAAAPNSAPNSGPADAFDGASDRLVLAPEGHPWATDPEPIELGESGVDHAETIPVAETIHATGGEPEPVAPPAKGTPAPHQLAPSVTIPAATIVLRDLTSSDHAPRTGGGGRADPDDFLARIERELDALAREDADLVARARELVAARTDVAARIERLRTAGEVYRAVMAGRAA